MREGPVDLLQGWEKVKLYYNDQRQFQVREIEVNGKVVSRLMKIDTNLKYLPSEDLFNEIYDLHVGSGHCGWDLLNKKIKEKFANVTIENISAFLKRLANSAQHFHKDNLCGKA